MASEDELKAIWRMLSDAYPDNKNQPGTAAVYAMVLADIPDDVLRAAALECVSRCRFFPRASEIREAAAQLRRPQRTPALEAWAELKALVTRWGYYRFSQVEWPNPMLEQAARAMGWETLCLMTYDDEPSHRARFIEYWEGRRQQDVDDLVRLPDVTEIQAQIRAGVSRVARALAAPGGER